MTKWISCSVLWKKKTRLAYIALASRIYTTEDIVLNVSLVILVSVTNSFNEETIP